MLPLRASVLFRYDHKAPTSPAFSHEMSRKVTINMTSNKVQCYHNMDMFLTISCRIDITGRKLLHSQNVQSMHSLYPILNYDLGRSV